MTAKSTSALIAEIQQQLPTNNQGGITAATLQSVLIDMTSSFFNLVTNSGYSGTIVTALATLTMELISMD